MDVSQELMDGMQLNLHRQHWKRTEFIMFDDMHNISRSQQVMNQNCHHGMVWVVVGKGFCFLSKDWCISTVI